MKSAESFTRLAANNPTATVAIMYTITQKTSISAPCENRLRKFGAYVTNLARSSNIASEPPGIHKQKPAARMAAGRPTAREECQGCHLQKLASLALLAFFRS